MLDLWYSMIIVEVVKMKKLFAILLAVLMLCAPVVLAEEAPVEDDLPAEELSEDAGTTPDSALYGLDRALERIELALTFGRAAKAKKGLKHAKERLAEVKAMARAKKLAAMEEAQEAHDEILEEVQENLEEVSEEDSEADLEVVTDLENELNEHDQEVEKVEAFVDLKIIGELTEEQQQKLDELIASLKASGDNVRVKFKAKKDRAFIKYKTEFDKTDKQVKEKMEEIREEMKVEVGNKLVEKSVARLNAKIAKFEELVANAKKKGKDVSKMEIRLEKAKAVVAEIEGKSYEEARPLIKEVNQLLNFRQAYIKDKVQEGLEKVRDREKDSDEEAEEEVECITDADCMEEAQENTEEVCVDSMCVRVEEGEQTGE